MKRLLTAVVLMMVGCAAPPPPGEALRSSKQRVTAAPDAEAFANIIRGNTDTALSLHRSLVEGDDSLFFSPLSIQSALGMAAGGAVGETLEHFGHVLPLSGEFHRSMNHLDSQLSSRGKNSTGAEGEPFALLRMNQLFVDETQHVEAPYLDLLAEEYGAGVQQLKISANPEDAAKKINDWVSQNTKSRIPRLFGPGAINGDTRLVLVNAMYFSAGWAKPFTRDDQLDFAQLDGSSTSLKMMGNPNIEGREIETDELQAISLPYSGNELSMRIVMPKADYRAFETELTAERLDGIFGQLTGASLDLSMPQFELKSSRDLIPALKQLGMELPFTGGADFSAMTGRPELFIETVVHEAWVDVSKSGTRAAAATGVGFGRESAPQVKRVIIDKPFLFFIVDDATGAVLFMGRYTKV